MKPEDLRDPARFLDLHAQAVAVGDVSLSEADRLNFFAAAYHARLIGSRNPPGLFVRDVTNQLRRRGIPESSVWRLVNRERPEWTRERWDEAQAELQGTIRPLVAEAVVS